MRSGQRLHPPPELDAYLCEEFKARLIGIKRSFESLLYIGPPLPQLQFYLSTLGAVKTLLTGGTQEQATTPNTSFFYGDTLPLQPGSYDLVISAFHLHAVPDIKTMLFQYRAALKPDGVMLCAFPGESTLHEIKQAAAQVDMALFNGAQPRVIPFLSLRAFAALMQEVGFELPVADMNHHLLTYETIADFWADLKDMGERSCLTPSRTGLLPPHYQEALERTLKKENDTFNVTLDLCFGQGWAPGEVRPKKLAPGQGIHSLKELLFKKSG